VEILLPVRTEDRKAITPGKENPIHLKTLYVFIYLVYGDDLSHSEGRCSSPNRSTCRADSARPGNQTAKPICNNTKSEAPNFHESAKHLTGQLLIRPLPNGDLRQWFCRRYHGTEEGGNCGAQLCNGLRIAPLLVVLDSESAYDQPYAKRPAPCQPRIVMEANGANHTELILPSQFLKRLPG
jgi:hypothetical protein